MQENITRWTKASKALRERFGREPTDAEIARVVRVTTAVASSTRRAIDVRSGTLASITDAGPAGEDGTLAPSLTDPRDESPIDRIVLAEDVEAVLGRIKKLTERELRVIKMRFGMAPFTHPMTGEEVGEVMEITRQAVHKIQDRALEKLWRDE